MATMLIRSSSISGVAPPRVHCARTKRPAAPFPPERRRRPRPHQRPLLASASSALPSPPPRASSFPATVFNLANLIMGAGYVSMPYALAAGGPLPALGVLLVLAALFCGTGRGLSEALTALEQQRWRQRRGEEEKSKEQQHEEVEYADVVAEAAAAAAAATLTPTPTITTATRAAVSALVLAELAGCACCFVALGGDAVRAALMGVLQQQQQGVGVVGVSSSSSLLSCVASSKAACTAAAACLMLPTLMLPDLSALSVLGFFGVVAAAACAALLAGLAAGGVLPPLLPPLTTTTSSPWLSPGPDLPLVLGVCAFCFAGHGAFPAVRASMGPPLSRGGVQEEREGNGGRALFPAALVAGYASVALLCAAVGVAGFACFGAAADPVFTASLQSSASAAAAAAAATATATATTQTLGLAATVAVLLTAVNPLSAFAVTLEPVGAALERRRGLLQGRPRVARLAAGLLCAAVAVACPYAADLAALTGAVLTMSVSLVLPGVAHLVLMTVVKRRGGGGEGAAMLPWRPGAALVDCLAVVVGLACAVVGGRAALAALAGKLKAAAATAGG
jgi:vesicular inhibitory amino acid transporter